MIEKENKKSLIHPIKTIQRDYWEIVIDNEEKNYENMRKTLQDMNVLKAFGASTY